MVPPSLLEDSSVITAQFTHQGRQYQTTWTLPLHLEHPTIAFSGSNPPKAWGGEHAFWQSSSFCKVIGILPDSQAARLGLQAGGIILQYQDRSITRLEQLVAFVKHNKTREVKLVIKRGDTQLSKSLSPGTIGVQLENGHHQGFSVGGESLIVSELP